MAMYCSECGKQNPEGAKFCAFCGAKLTAPTAPQPEPKQPAPTQPTPKPDPHQAYRRPSGDDVRPIADNPAQPTRGSLPRPAQPRPTPQPAQQIGRAHV